MPFNIDTNFKEMCVNMLISFGIEECVINQLYSELLYEARKYKQGVSAEYIYEILSKFTDEDKLCIRKFENSVDSEAELFVIERFKNLITTCTITTR